MDATIVGDAAVASLSCARCASRLREPLPPVAIKDDVINGGIRSVVNAEMSTEGGGSCV